MSIVFMKKYYIFIIICYIIFLGKIDAYISYNVGDKVSYKGINFYVIENSDDSKSTVTLLKETFLSQDDIQTYSQDIGAMRNGYLMNYGSGSTAYSNSYVKKTVDAWAEAKLDANDLVIDSTGYSVRLLSHEDLVGNLGYKNSSDTFDSYPSSAGETPIWVNNVKYNYWTMSSREDSNISVWCVASYGLCFADMDNTIAVRPVITIKKESIDYYDIMYEYGNTKFYKIKEDDKSIVLLKVEPITSNDTSKILEGTELLNKVNLNKEYAQMAYYSFENCMSSGDQSGCSTDYSISDIKQVVDLWDKKYINLSDISYETRLLDISDIDIEKGQICSNECIDKYNVANSFLVSDNYGYWTLSTADDSNSKVWFISKDGEVYKRTVASDHTGGDKPTIRPVIVIKKDVSDDSEKDINLDNNQEKNKESKKDDENKNEVKNIFNVPNTVQKISVIYIMIGVVIISISIVITFIERVHEK